MKKIILTFVLAFLLQNKAFTQFEMNLTVPLGISYIFPYAEGTTDHMIQSKSPSINYRGVTTALDLIE